MHFTYCIFIYVFYRLLKMCFTDVCIFIHVFHRSLDADEMADALRDVMRVHGCV